jgi:hypothetical protein
MSKIFYRDPSVPGAFCGPELFNAFGEQSASITWRQRGFVTMLRGMSLIRTARQTLAPDPVLAKEAGGRLDATVNALLSQTAIPYADAVAHWTLADEARYEHLMIAEAQRRIDPEHEAIVTDPGLESGFLGGLITLARAPGDLLDDPAPNEISKLRLNITPSMPEICAGFLACTVTAYPSLPVTREMPPDAPTA